MFITVIHVSTALFMILVVLVQGGNSGGVGAALGGGNSSGVFGAAGATSFLGKLTYGAAAIFMITTISLSVMQGKSGNIGLEERLKNKAQENKPAEAQPAKPEGAAAPGAQPNK